MNQSEYLNGTTETLKEEYSDQEILSDIGNYYGLRYQRVKKYTTPIFDVKSPRAILIDGWRCGLPPSLTCPVRVAEVKCSILY